MKRIAITMMGLALLSAAACSDEGDQNLAPSNDIEQGTDENNNNNNKKPGEDPEKPSEPARTVLDDRIVDYNEALRTASLKLTDRLPRLSDIIAVRDADDPKAAYEERLDAMFESNAFRRRLVRYWRDVFRQGGDALDTAPVFAARTMIEGRPYTDLFTATENTCPTYSNEQGTFADGNCNNGVDTHAGVLTNPGVMAQFYSNMAFRRVRWVQEIFACQSFPSEYREDPLEVGKEKAAFTSPWDFESISNDPVEFLDTASVVCANCHSSMNHIAPLFANFDMNGVLQNTSQVQTPLSPEPVPTERSHWLPPSETTAWRKGLEAETLPELGERMAEDTLVAECLVARIYNFAMSKQDIVSDLATIPAEVLQPHVDTLKANNNNLLATLKSIMKSDDFVQF